MLEYAISKAREIPFVKYQKRLYCVITDKRGKIISEAANNYNKTHPLQSYYSFKAGFSKKRCCIHAELGAILKARGKGHSIYIARVDSKNNIGLAKPCPACQMLINELGYFKRIIYTE